MITAVLVSLTGSLVGCDPIWVRRSFIEVDAASFPSCVQAALAEAGLQPILSTDSDGRERLLAHYLAGALNVTAAASSSAQGQVVVLKLIGNGYRPPKEVEPHLEEGMAKLTATIAKSCARA